MWWDFKSRTRDPEAEVDEEALESTNIHPTAARLLELQRASGNQAVQSLLAGEELEDSQTQAKNQADAGAAETDVVEKVAAAGSSGGQTLDQQVKGQMEGRFGKDLSEVQIHDDSNAAESAETLQARAFTRGRDIYFASGKYAPTTDDGLKLLAHELTHVVQQGESSAPTKHLSDRSDASEREADSISSRFHGDHDATFRPTQAPTAAIQRDEWFEEDIEHKKERTIYCRPIDRFHTLHQLLRRVEVQVFANPSPKKKPKEGKLPEVMKKAPGAKDTESYVDGRLAFTQFTSKDVKTKIDDIFRSDRATFVTEEIVNKVRKIVEAERLKAPEIFSMVQGIEMATCAKAPESSPTCIGTMNLAVQKLFGPKVIQTKDMGKKGTVLEAIEALRDKSLTDEEENFKATYAGSDKRFQILKESDVKFSGAGRWLEDTAKADGEGMHIFVFSVANGYHSVSIMVLREKKSSTITWKDQNVGTVTLTASEFDEKIKKLCISRYRSWVVDKFNEKYDPDVDSYDDIKDDARTPKVEDEVKSTVLNDISKNLIVKLKPPAVK